MHAEDNYIIINLKSKYYYMPAVKRSSKKHSRRASKSKIAGKKMSKKMSKLSGGAKRRVSKKKSKRSSKSKTMKSRSRKMRGGYPPAPSPSPTPRPNILDATKRQAAKNASQTPNMNAPLPPLPNTLPAGAAPSKPPSAYMNK
jgi:hypothetical protein